MFVGKTFFYIEEKELTLNIDVLSYPILIIFPNEETALESNVFRCLRKTNQDKCMPLQ